MNTQNRTTDTALTSSKFKGRVIAEHTGAVIREDEDISAENMGEALEKYLKIVRSHDRSNFRMDYLLKHASSYQGGIACTVGGEVIAVLPL